MDCRETQEVNRSDRNLGMFSVSLVFFNRCLLNLTISAKRFCAIDNILDVRKGLSVWIVNIKKNMYTFKKESEKGRF